MILINQDGAYLVQSWKGGYLIRAKHTEDIRKMMTRLHGKRWCVENLAEKIIAVPKALWKYRIVLKASEWNTYVTKVSKAMDYTDLFEELRKQDGMTEDKLKALMGVQMHIDKGWTYRRLENAESL